MLSYAKRLPPAQGSVTYFNGLLKISPLTSLGWYFDAGEVAKLKLFYEDSISSNEVSDVSFAIEKIREKVGIKKYENIPI